MWALPAKADVANADVIVLQDNTGKDWVALPVDLASWIDMYFGSVERQQLALSTCPYVEFIEIGGKELKKVNWDKVNLGIGRAGNVEK